jgi:hypothetical protein
MVDVLSTVGAANKFIPDNINVDTVRLVIVAFNVSSVPELDMPDVFN